MLRPRWLSALHPLAQPCLSAFLCASPMSSSSSQTRTPLPGGLPGASHSPFTVPPCAVMCRRCLAEPWADTMGARDTPGWPLSDLLRMSGYWAPCRGRKAGPWGPRHMTGLLLLKKNKRTLSHDSLVLKMSIILLCVHYYYVIFFFLVLEIKTHLLRSLKHPGPQPWSCVQDRDPSPEGKACFGGAAPPREDRRGSGPVQPPTQALPGRVPPPSHV